MSLNKKFPRLLPSPIGKGWKVTELVDNSFKAYNGARLAEACRLFTRKMVAGNGTVAELKRHGAKVAARRLVPPLMIRDEPEGVTIDTGERLFGAVTLINVFPDDARALAAPLTLV